MKAVNLIPPDNKRSAGGRATVGAPRGPAVALIGLLVVALAFVTIYVLTSNTVKDRKAKLATVQSEVSAAQAEAAKLTNYADFVKLASNRLATVSQIATQRFDWHTALSDLSKVVPANTSLQSLLGTVSPSASVSGAGGSTTGSAVGTGTLRTAITAPAFELKGCTQTQDDVAQLMSNLRLINGVTRVTLADSTKQDPRCPGRGRRHGDRVRGERRLPGERPVVRPCRLLPAAAGPVEHGHDTRDERDHDIRHERDHDIGTTSTTLDVDVDVDHRLGHRDGVERRCTGELHVRRLKMTTRDRDGPGCRCDRRRDRRHLVPRDRAEALRGIKARRPAEGRPDPASDRSAAGSGGACGQDRVCRELHEDGAAR